MIFKLDYGWGDLIATIPFSEFDDNESNLDLSEYNEHINEPRSDLFKHYRILRPAVRDNSEPRFFIIANRKSKVTEGYFCSCISMLEPKYILNNEYDAKDILTLNQCKTLNEVLNSKSDIPNIDTNWHWLSGIWNFDNNTDYNFIQPDYRLINSNR